jgi:trigger factor
LKIETEIQEDHQAKLTVEVEADLMESMKRRAARKIGRRVKVPGFRPGKAPYQVIVRHVGEGAVTEEAIELLVDEIYPKVIEEAEINPYGPGTLKNVNSLEPPVLEFLVPLEADITLGDYRSLRKPYEPKEITEADVEDVLTNLRERQALIEPVERPAQEEDLVTVRISATRKNVEDNQDPVLIPERSVPIIVRSSGILKPSESEADQGDDEENDEWPFPGFSNYLVGMSANDEKLVAYTYPEDSKIESFRGVEADFSTVVETVKARKLPELDDDFATSLGDYENMEALRSSIRTSLIQQAEKAYNESYDNDILETAIEQTVYKYPPQMLEEEIDSVVKDLTHRLEQQGFDIDLYLKTRGLDMDGLREEMKPVAETRLKRALFLFELAQAEDLKVDQEELEAETNSTVDYLSRVLPQKEARKLSNTNVQSNLIGNIMVDLLSQKALNRFRSICKGEVENIEQPIVEESKTENEPGEQTVEIVAEVDQTSSVAGKEVTDEEEIFERQNEEVNIENAALGSLGEDTQSSEGQSA